MATDSINDGRKEFEVMERSIIRSLTIIRFLIFMEYGGSAVLKQSLEKVLSEVIDPARMHYAAAGILVNDFAFKYAKKLEARKDIPIVPSLFDATRSKFSHQYNLN